MYTLLYLTMLLATDADLHTVRFDHLGLVIGARPDALVVTKVDEDGPADTAGVRVGAQVVAVRGVPVDTLEQLRRLLDPARGAVAIDLTVEQDAPVLVVKPSGDFRVAALAIGNGYTSAEGARSAWLGAYTGYAVKPGIWILLGCGYIAVGPDPGFGKHGIAPVVGGEYELALTVPGLSLFARTLAGTNFSFGSGSAGAAGTIQPFNVFGQLGVRFHFLDVALSTSFGPGDGINVGVAAGLVFTADP